MKLISKFAAYSMLVAVLITNPLFAETAQNEDTANDNVSVITNVNATKTSLFI